MPSLKPHEFMKFILFLVLPFSALAHDDPNTLRTQEGEVDCRGLISIHPWAGMDSPFPHGQDTTSN